MRESVLGQQRTKLWAAFGEEPSSKYTVGQTNSKGEGLEWNTDAPMLKNCWVANKAWTKPVWGRLLDGGRSTG